MYGFEQILEKIMYTSVNPQFYYMKMGFMGGQNYIGMFSWWLFAQISGLVCRAGGIKMILYISKHENI